MQHFRHTTLKTVSAICLGALTGLAGGRAQATVIYHQAPDYLTGGVSLGPLGPSSQRVADDIRLGLGNGQAYQIGRVRAFMISGMTDNPDLYQLELYADNHGRPGALMTTRTATQVEDFGTWQFGLRIKHVWFDLNTLLQPEVTYWLSVAGLAGTSGNVRMVTSAYGQTANGSVAWSRVGLNDWQPTTSSIGWQFRDLAFSLEGGQIVPVPGGGVLLGCTGVLALRRRRR
jgi:hypothetical protein